MSGEPTALDTVADPPGERSGVARGDVIGRFVVLGELGAGGMGIVYAAYDPDLDRKVAIKLLRGSASDGHARLLREAQAMAKIEHPNVITVHEVGMHHDRVYLAMELASGGTLRAWLAAASRSRRDILDVFAQAGRGLAAAHASELVHRDFKPDNVLLAKDGRVRVTDFGIVSLGAEPAAADGDTPISQQLTRTGALMGTPSYMAPEQFAGTATAKSDQFAFCVALYEALYGERPFRGATLAELCVVVERGEVPPPPKGRDVPAWLRRVLLRGLSVDPEARFPSMDALLAALAADPARRRWRYVTLAGVAAAAVAIVLLAARDPQVDPCRVDERAEAVWNPARRAALAEAFARSTRSTASFVRASLLVDEWTDRWELGAAAACRAPAAAWAVERDTCLSRYLVTASSTIDAVLAGDGTTLDRALELFAELPPVERCSDDIALEHSAAATPTSLSPAAIAARSAVAAARVQARLGRDDAAVAMLNPAIEAARTARASLTLADGLLLLGNIQFGHHDAHAEATLRDALHAAIDADDTSTELRAMAALVTQISVDPKRLDAAHELAEVAEATAARSTWVSDHLEVGEAVLLLDLRRGDIGHARELAARVLAFVERQEPDSLHEVIALMFVARVDEAQGHYDDAGDHARQALAIVARVEGADTASYAVYLGELGTAEHHAGRYDEATTAFAAALAIDEAIYGHYSPVVAEMIVNLANVSSSRGDEQRAHDLFRDALGVWERAPGPDPRDPLNALSSLATSDAALGHLDLARSEGERALAGREAIDGREHYSLVGPLINLGSVAQQQGQLDDAQKFYERALAIVERGDDPDRTDKPDILINLGDLLRVQHRLADAAAMDTRAVPAAEQVYGADHPHTAIALANLGQVQMDLGNVRDALATMQRARNIFEAKLPSDHPYIGAALVIEGSALVALGRADEAVPLLERALPIVEASGSPTDVAEARAALTRARAHR